MLLGNLVPSCADCNSAKGNTNWRQFVRQHHPEAEATLEKFVIMFPPIGLTQDEMASKFESELHLFEEIKSSIFGLMHEADANCWSD